MVAQPFKAGGPLDPQVETCGYHLPSRRDWDRF